MTRTFRLPDVFYLPEPSRKKVPPLNGDPVVERSPVLRLLCVHGVADSLAQDWFIFMNDAPPDIEIAVHEFPGHGHRDKEPVCNGLDELVEDCYLAFKDSMDTGSFALLGHSIGCLVVTQIAKRAREELGVEPCMVFMVERGAGQYPLFTEDGNRRLHEDPLPFMAIYQPTVVSFYNSAGAIGQRTLDMWQKGWFCENETLEQGYHTFKCPVKAIFAEHMVRPYCKYEDLDPYQKVLVDDAGKVFNTKPEDTEEDKWKNGMCFIGHFPYHTFEAWEEWTEFKGTFKVIEVKDCDHMTIKASRYFKETIYGLLREEVIKPWSAIG